MEITGERHEETHGDKHEGSGALWSDGSACGGDGGLRLLSFRARKGRIGVKLRSNGCFFFF